MTDVVDWGATLALAIGGVDRTADLLGAGEVDRELNASGVASFLLSRASGEPALGAAVTIGGIVAVPYHGEVSDVQYAPGQDAWAVKASDGMQALFEGAAALAAAGAAALPDVTAGQIEAAQVAAVLALLPAGAVWHRDLHGEFADGWSAAQDALGTVAASIYVESGGLHSVSWAGSGATTTLSHAAGDIYDGSVYVYRATARELIREIGATVEVGYSRWNHWKISIGWAILDWDFCEWRLLPYPLPTRQMIAEAANANPWAVCESSGLSSGGGDGLGITTQGLPATGPQCSGNWNLLAGAFQETPVAWTNRDYGTPSESVWTASWKAARQWSESLTETYRIVVRAPSGTTGAVVEDAARSYDAPSDDAGWDGAPASRSPSGTGWQVDQTGILSWRDNIDPADRAAVVGGRIRMLAHRLRASRRLSTMQCTVEPGAEPGIGTRVRMLAEHHDLTGQVTRLVTAWDLDSHSAGCTVTMAVTSGSLADDDLAAPDAPVIPAVPDGTSLTGSVVLGTHIGGASASDPVQSDDWTGWVTKVPDGLWGGVQYPVAGSQVYEIGFTLVTPDVPETMRAGRGATVAHTIEIDPL